MTIFIVDETHLCRCRHEAPAVDDQFIELDVSLTGSSYMLSLVFMTCQVFIQLASRSSLSTTTNTAWV